MDALLVVVVFGLWLVSLIQRQAKKAGQKQRPAESPPAGRRRGLRPAEMDVSQQPTSAWEGPQGAAPLQSERMATSAPPDEGESLWQEINRPGAADTAWQSIMNAEPVKAQRHEARPERVTLSPAEDVHANRAAIPGLNLAFGADAMVQGVIFSEVLTRRQHGRPYRRSR